MNPLRCSSSILALVGLTAGLQLTGAAESETGLSRAEAEAALKRLWAERRDALVRERSTEMEAKEIVFEDKKMRWEERVFGEVPDTGRSLWISMHGGGNAPTAVNDRQWRNQIRLYEPTEGIYVAPRAPTDNWNLWHEAHIDPMFDRLIEDYVVLRGVNPDRVYLMGYSAGGDGVWQLAPRMADRWAAAAMMAGHPNEASLLGLRNLAFALFVGGNDRAYKRNEVVAQRGEQLAELQAVDPGGYEHLARVYEGMGHWMNGKDAEALPWMAKHDRNAWPKKVVWLQDDVTHTHFYWLEVGEADAKVGDKIIAEVERQEIRLTGDVPEEMTLRLSDKLVDLDQPVRVTVDGEERFNGKVPRSEAVIRESLERRADPGLAATAEVVLGR